MGNRVVIRLFLYEIRRGIFLLLRRIESYDRLSILKKRSLRYKSWIGFNYWNGLLKFEEIIIIVKFVKNYKEFGIDCFNVGLLKFNVVMFLVSILYC